MKNKQAGHHGDNPQQIRTNEREGEEQQRDAELLSKLWRRVQLWASADQVFTAGASQEMVERCRLRLHTFLKGILPLLCHKHGLFDT